MLRIIWSVAFTVLLLVGCNEESIDKKGTAEMNVYQDLPMEMKEVLEAHGGLDKWNKQKALTYDFSRGERKESHQIDLENRKVRLKGDNWIIGFDGDEVWVSPDKETYGGNSARFYHNLLFYFYAMPFVLADPGIKYEVLEPKEIQGAIYNRISIKYHDGVGDAPDDEYIMCYDPDSKKMEWLMYTVTYFSGEPGSKYNALHYSGWKETSGLLLPETMTGYQTSGDTIAEKRYENLFENVVLSEQAFDQEMFEMPEGAEVDSLK